MTGHKWLSKITNQMKLSNWKFSPKFSTSAELDVKFSPVLTWMLIFLNMFECSLNWTYGPPGHRFFLHWIFLVFMYLNNLNHDGCFALIALLKISHDFVKLPTWSLECDATRQTQTRVSFSFPHSCFIPTNIYSYLISYYSINAM